MRLALSLVTIIRPFLPDFQNLCVLASWREVPLPRLGVRSLFPRLGVMFLFALTGALVERRTDLIE